MLKWFLKKGQNARVVMCIKTLLWELEAAEPAKRAKFLALAHVILQDFLDNIEIPFDVFDKPLDFSRDDLMRFFEFLEGARISAESQRDQLSKSLGESFPDFALEHAINTNRALEIWMVTIGVGIVPERRDEVRKVWQMLTQSKPYLDDAIDEILKMEADTAAILGSMHTAFFSHLDVTEWKTKCEFIPSQLMKELYFD